MTRSPRPPHSRSRAKSSASDRRGRPGKQPVRGPRRAFPADDDHVIYGLHPVASAFANPNRLRHRLVATANALRRLREQGTEPDVPVEKMTSNAISRLVGPDAVHQGCLLYCDPLPDQALTDLQAPEGASDLRLLVLDQVTDPHNVGAVLRSAAAFAMAGIVVTARHSPRETAVLAKSAAGALDVVPLIRVRNLASALEELNAAGYRTIGLDAEADRAIEEMDFGGPYALVLGAEGKGLRQKTAATCTDLARIDMPGRMPSLNVSNAAALALYIADRKSEGG